GRWGSSSGGRLNRVSVRWRGPPRRAAPTKPGLGRGRPPWRPASRYTHPKPPLFFPLPLLPRPGAHHPLPPGQQHPVRPALLRVLLPVTRKDDAGVGRHGERLVLPPRLLVLDRHRHRPLVRIDGLDPAVRHVLLRGGQDLRGRFLVG